MKKLDNDWNVVYVAIPHSDFKPQGRVPQSRFAPLAAHMRQDHHMGHFCHREYLREDFEWKDLEEAGVARYVDEVQSFTNRFNQREAKRFSVPEFIHCTLELWSAVPLQTFCRRSAVGRQSTVQQNIRQEDTDSWAQDSEDLCGTVFGAFNICGNFAIKSHVVLPLSLGGQSRISASNLFQTLLIEILARWTPPPNVQSRFFEVYRARPPRDSGCLSVAGCRDVGVTIRKRLRSQTEPITPIRKRVSP
ncbi:hypothetical protein B0H14DRAFT_3755321 [Mycena olivaceomarginata]|nr:hypothetical protein B0H14DRAFT_3755321 [Mycena olivaceomarginata]